MTAELLHKNILEKYAGSFSGRLRSNVDLSRTNWFRVGGVAQWLFKPENTKDLSDFLRELPADIPVMALGVGSNVIIRDGFIEGVVIKLGRNFAQMTVNNCELAAGAACLDINAALFACDHGLAGLEFLSGIPGTLGGAVRMNAGAYGAEIKDVLIECEIVLRSGEIKTLSAAECGFSYRRSSLPEGAIVTQVLLKTTSADRLAIAQRIQDIQNQREATQPIRTRTGGSTFKNPEGHKAWELIDRAGCRGMTLGGAQISEKHCNFMINTGNATAADLENLGNKVIEIVREKTGITLEWEIKLIGKSG